MSVTITPTEERVRLRVAAGRLDSPRTLYAMRRWLERGARRKGRHINVPSVTVQFERDASLRQTFLYAYADSFPETLPSWLREAKAVVGYWPA